MSGITGQREDGQIPRARQECRRLITHDAGDACMLGKRAQ